MPTIDDPPEHKLNVRADATRGLTELEDDLNLRVKSADFIAIDADLSDGERAQYRERDTEEADTMTGLTERFTEPGRSEGLVQARHDDEAVVLVRQLQRRLARLDAVVLDRSSLGERNRWMDGQSAQ